MNSMTIALPQNESNVVFPTRAQLFPCAVRRFRRSRRMVLDCENCHTITRHNPQRMRRCPICGVPVWTQEPGKPHRKVVTPL
jgi:rRNA maturation endonuclease Nob1